MTTQTYTVTATRSQPYYSETTVQAASPAEALAKVRGDIEQDSGESTNRTTEWEGYEVRDAGMRVVLTETVDEPPLDRLADRADRLKDRLVDWDYSSVEETEIVNQDIGTVRVVADLIRAGGLTHAGRVLAERYVAGAEQWCAATTGEKAPDGRG